MSTLLNSPLEVGLRILVVLDVEFPAHRNLDQLLVVDHMALHTEDFGGPGSLHPALPLRSADVGARRESIRRGLELLIHRGLAAADLSDSGIAFLAGETAHGVVGLMESPYVKAYRDKVIWVTENESLESDGQVRERLSSIVESWPELSSEGVVP